MPVAAPGLLVARYARWEGVDKPFSVVETALSGELGAGEVLVEIDLATVCGSDVHTVAGHRPSPAPGVLGHEQVGRVVGAGPGAPRCLDGTPLEPGLRVVWSVAASCGNCARCARGLPQKCLRLRKYGHEPLDERAPLTGGFATHCVVLPGTAIARVPDSVPDVVAAPASCATATVAAAVAAAGHPAAGSTALVSGAGMLGLTAVGMLADAGVEVVAVDPHADRRARALRFGATRAVAPGAGPGDVDVAIELSGAASAVADCLGSLAVGGTAVLAGSVSPGPTVAVDPEKLVRGLHRVVGVHNYAPRDLQTALDFLARTTRPFADLVEGRFGLADLGAAVVPGAAPRRAVDPRS